MDGAAAAAAAAATAAVAAAAAAANSCAGYLGPGGYADFGQYYNCTGGAHRQVDYVSGVRWWEG